MILNKLYFARCCRPLVSCSQFTLFSQLLYFFFSLNNMNVFLCLLFIVFGEKLFKLGLHENCLSVLNFYVFIPLIHVIYQYILDISWWQIRLRRRWYTQDGERYVRGSEDLLLIRLLYIDAWTIVLSLPYVLTEQSKQKVLRQILVCGTFFQSEWQR